jgi:(p)ppGpp synthase/HD superfamily hydrolase
MITRKIVRAYAYALEAHKNQTYGDSSYAVHIINVVTTALRFINNVKPELREEVVQACSLHDTMEDAGIAYSELKNRFGEFVADTVYDVTNEKGKSRKEKNERTIASMSKNRNAVFVKLCDRIANTSYSLENNSQMHEMYASEYGHFKRMLYVPGEYDDMWSELDAVSLSRTVTPAELRVESSGK